MIIGIDIAQNSFEKTGIEYYNFELLKALNKIVKKDKLIVYTNNRAYVPLNSTENLQIKEIVSESPTLKWVRKVVKQTKKDKVDVFLSLSLFTTSFFFRKSAQVVYDIQPIRFPEFWPKSAVIKFRFLLKLAVLRSKALLTISQFTKDDLIALYPGVKNKTHVIGSGLHEWAESLPSKDNIKTVKEKYNLPSKYILSVSTLQPRKNYINMIKAFAIFKKENPEYKYIIAGKKGWYYEEIFNEVKNLSLDEDVIFLGYVPEEDFPALYNLSKSLLFCSYGEGFGLPPLEAYAMHTPSVLSNIPVLKEVLKDDAVYVDPKNPLGIAKGLSKSVKIKNDFTKEILENHTWEKVATNSYQILTKIAKSY